MLGIGNVKETQEEADAQIGRVLKGEPGEDAASAGLFGLMCVVY
ncbi:hypothetical protein [Ktedonospora formicarum]|nr:hypothetical protein [Ktedonospora formicarum]